MSACPTIAQVRLASQCDTSESDAASRVVERHRASQLERNLKHCETAKRTKLKFFFDKITGHGHSDSKFYILVRWHSTASAPLIPSGSWSAQLDVSSLRPGGPLCIEGITSHKKSRYREDCLRLSHFTKIVRNVFGTRRRKRVSAKMHHDTSIGQVYRLCADGDGSGPLHEGSHDGVTGKWRQRSFTVTTVEFLKV